MFDEMCQKQNKVILSHPPRRISRSIGTQWSTSQERLLEVHPTERNVIIYKEVYNIKCPKE
jgi:hypothetical protein